MSSRNTYLNTEERQAAAVLYRALAAAEKMFKDGQRNADALRQRMEAVLSREPLARVEYVSVAHPETLAELEGSLDRALLSLAVYIGKARLIDNLLIWEGKVGGSGESKD